VFFVDSAREPTSIAADNALPAADSIVARRRLNDGREFEVYKVFYEPADLAARLADLGWRFEVRRTRRYFVYGHGGRAGA
ncbi:MAG TPA: class I SAM-dependent methyltransferase, partial [Gammaproteobacteria bacterium]|nr:class I SAM-dependent methyltransferase [Gammaproteobacteria bacterium]